jgi:cobalt-zinc-cadmium resistance protein CzcA
VSGWLLAAALRHRDAVLIATLLAALAGAAVASRLDLDALPDVTTNQVIILTDAPGLTPLEVETLVTRRVEAAAAGIDGLESSRSLSRYGISSVTLIFEDRVDPWRARQAVTERLAGLAGALP